MAAKKPKRPSKSVVAKMQLKKRAIIETKTKRTLSPRDIVVIEVRTGGCESGLRGHLAVLGSDNDPTNRIVSVDADSKDPVTYVDMDSNDQITHTDTISTILRTSPHIRESRRFN